MRTIATMTSIVLSLTLSLGIAACGKKTESPDNKTSETVIVTDTEAADEDSEATDEPADSTTTDGEGESIVVPVKRAQGPLAFVADDELCSILVTGKGSSESGYGYGIEITNNTEQALTFAAGSDATVNGTPVEAQFSVEIAPEDTVEGVLALPYNEDLTDASAFEGAPFSATLEVLDATGSSIASYPVIIV